MTAEATPVVFETEGDEAIHDSMVERIVKVLGCKAMRLAPCANADYLLIYHDGRLALANTKRRSGPSAQYPTLFYSIKKTSRGVLTSQHLNVPFLLIVEWSDGIFYISVHDHRPFKSRKGNRSDLTTPLQSVDPTYEIPMDLFHKLEV